MSSSSISQIELRTLDPEQIRQHYKALAEVTRDLPDDGWREENFLLELPDKWQLSFAAWQLDQPVAYALLSRKAPDTVHLHRLMVAEAWRGQGLGQCLVKELLQRTSSAGAAYCSLKVERGNGDARRFYRRHGFQEIGRVRNYVEMRRASSPMPAASAAQSR
jgi:ribosomal protein S18 acetylase RimI-like enzyme